MNTDSLHFLIRKTGVMHTAIVTRKAESEFNILISVLISISSWASLYSLGRRTRLNAHTQVPFYSAGTALTTFPFCWDPPVPRYWEKLLSLLPYCLTRYLGRDVRAGRSWGCEALSPAPSSGLAPGTLEMSGLPKPVPGEGGLLWGSVPLIPALKSRHDPMSPLLGSCSVRCSGMVPAFLHPYACRCALTCK